MDDEQPVNAKRIQKEYKKNAKRMQKECDKEKLAAWKP